MRSEGMQSPAWQAAATGSEFTRPNDGGAARDVAAEPDSRLRRLADGALRRAARAAGRGAPPDDGVLEALHQVCETARERGMLVEQLLILLKESWHELPEARLVLRQDANGVLARLISMCIAAYYAPQQQRST